jgi:hypothetical protein
MYPQQFPASAPPPAYPNQVGFNSLQQGNASIDSEERLRKFQYLVDRYEINRDFATRLRALEGYEIVFIVDGKSNNQTNFLSPRENLSEYPNPSSSR